MDHGDARGTDAGSQLAGPSGWHEAPGIRNH